MATSTALSPLEVAARLDAAVLFLGALGEDHPAFMGNREGLFELVGACSTARSDLEERNALDGAEVERIGAERLEQHGLSNVETQGLGSAFTELQEQIKALVSQILGECEWDPAK